MTRRRHVFRYLQISPSAMFTSAGGGMAEGLQQTFKCPGRLISVLDTRKVLNTCTNASEVRSC
jgi:hypothetical protein